MNIINNERYNQAIDEAYENYLVNFIPPNCPSYLDVQPSYYEPMTKEWFVKSIKERGTRGEEFSQEWGLKIEERELSFNHRYRLGDYQPYNIEGKVEYEKGLDYITQEQFETFHNKEMDKLKIPNKLITLTYKNETIECYEN